MNEADYLVIYKKLLDASSDIYLIITVHSICRYANPAAIQFFCGPEDKLTNKPIQETFKQFPTFWSSLQRGLKQAVKAHKKVEILTPIKNDCQYFLQIHPIPEQKEKIFLIQGKNVIEMAKLSHCLLYNSEKLPSEFDWSKRKQQIDLLHQTCQEISHTLDLKVVMNALKSFITGSMNCSTLLVWQYDSHRQMISCTYGYQHELGELDISKIPPIPLNPDENSDPKGWAIQSGAPILTGDYENLLNSSKIGNSGNPQTDSSINKKEKRNKTNSAIFMPIESRGKVIGVIEVLSCYRNAFSEEDLKLIEVITPHISAAVQNATYFQQTQYNLKEKIAAEKKLQKYTEGLEEIVKEQARELKKAQDELIKQEKLAALGQLAGGVAHELRNPLGVIKNVLYLIHVSNEAHSEELRNHLDMIENETENAQYVISSLLDYARPGTTKPQRIKIEELVINALNRSKSPNSIRIQTDFRDGLKEVPVDVQQMEHVLMNLFTNAVQAMPDGGTLTIRTEEVNDTVQIKISDTGCGISEENLENLFKPLYSTKARGIGLGLAVSKLFVEANGGTISVETIIGKGTTFSIRFPV